jgi:hypothetical protein
MTLTDTQLVLLSSASQRQDHLVTLPATLKGGAAKKVVDKLLTVGLLKEVAVKRDQPAWRTEDDRPIGLKITRAGLDALGIEPGEPEPKETVSLSPKKRPRKAAEGASAKAADTSGADAAPQAGTKQALVVSLLSRPEGATLDELVAATGWLPHTTRAALTGLRKKGQEIAKAKREDRKTVYRIDNAEPADGAKDAA